MLHQESMKDTIMRPLNPKAMKKNIKVSCIIPTYKRSDTLLRAVTSVLNQTYENIEVLVVDDNEPNDPYSLEVQEKLLSIKDNRLFYIKQEKHTNGAVARNIGIKKSKGEYIAFLDDDDEWSPQKIELQMISIMENPNCCGATCYYQLSSEGKVLRKVDPYNLEDIHKKVLNRSVAICTPTLVLKKDVLFKSGLFDESLIRHQDLQLILDFLYDNNISLVPEILVNVHVDSKINQPDTQKIINVKKLFFRKIYKHLKKYSKREQKTIIASHYFEIILVAIRERKYLVAMIYLGKIGLNIEAYKQLYKRYKSRHNERV